MEGGVDGALFLQRRDTAALEQRPCSVRTESPMPNPTVQLAPGNELAGCAEQGESAHACHKLGERQRGQTQAGRARAPITLRVLQPPWYSPTGHSSEAGEKQALGKQFLSSCEQQPPLPPRNEASSPPEPGRWHQAPSMPSSCSGRPQSAHYSLRAAWCLDLEPAGLPGVQQPPLAVGFPQCPPLPCQQLLGRSQGFGSWSGLGPWLLAFSYRKTPLAPSLSVLRSRSHAGTLLSRKMPLTVPAPHPMTPLPVSPLLLSINRVVIPSATQGRAV